MTSQNPNNQSEQLKTSLLDNALDILKFGAIRTNLDGL